MAYGRPVHIRSHRRSGKRRKQVSRSMRVVLSVVLLVAALVFGYTQLLANTCSGQETLRVYATEATANHLAAFATEWGRQEPSTSDGTCARVEVHAWGSAQVAAELATGWQLPDQAPPDVWVPASTAWVRVAAASDLAAPLLPADPPSIARSQAVLAMPVPMAEELDWPEPRLDGDTELRWEALLDEFGDGNGDWSQFDRPEWGRFRFGMGNPARDTAALLSLTAVVGATEEGAEAPPALQRAVALRRMLDDDAYYDTTEQLLTALAERDRESEEAALTLVSAFPALEHDVLAYNRRNPKVRLAAIYPVDGTVEADYPYLTLAAEWVSDRKREIAEAFLAHVRSDGPQATLRNAGFRGADGEPGADLTAEYGLSPEMVALPHAQLAPEAVTLTIDRWTALTSRLNVLLLFDTAEPPDDAEPWLEEARTAAQRVVELLDGDDQFGLWQPPQAAGEGFRTVVPLGALADILDDGRSRRDHVQAALADLAPASDAGLYVAIQAAFDTVLASYQQGAANLVVVVTDGTGSPDDISAGDLLEHLRSTPTDGQRVRVVTVGVGPEADVEALAEISKITGGQFRHSADGTDLVSQVRSAVFGSVSNR